MTTRNPRDAWGGHIGAEVAKFGTHMVEGSVEGPLVLDKLSFRASGHYDVRGGQYRNQANLAEKIGERSTRNVSLTLYAKPTDALTIKLYGALFKYDDGPPAQGVFLTSSFNCRDPSTGAGANNAICGVIPPFDVRLFGFNDAVDSRILSLVAPISLFKPALADHAGLVKIEEGTHAIIDYAFANGMTASAISAYHRNRRTSIHDDDGRDTRNTPNPNFPVRPNTLPYFNNLAWVDGMDADFSQELRLTTDTKQRFHATGGVNYVWVHSIPSWVTGDYPAGPRNPPTATGDIFVNTYAVFGGAYYDITPKVNLGAEARYQSDHVSSTDLPARTATLKGKWNSFSPRVTLSYKLTDEISAFGLWARGYRPGTFNIRLFSVSETVRQGVQAQTGAQPQVSQERIDDFELGSKARTWENRAQVSATIYRMNLNNQQAGTSVAIPDANGTLFALSVVANRGRTVAEGVELEGALQPIPQLNMTGSLAYNHTRIISLGAADLVGNTLGRAPEWTGSLTAAYRDRFTDTWDWFVRGEYTYKGKAYTGTNNLTIVPHRDMVNARAGVESDSVRFEAYVTNLFNTKTIPNAFQAFDRFAGLVNTVAVALPEKQVFGLRAGWDF